MAMRVVPLENSGVPRDLDDWYDFVSLIALGIPV